MDVLDKFKLEIVTPEKIIYSMEVEMVVIPGEGGEFGVLAGHIPIVSSIRSGFIKIYDKGLVIEKLFVADGFVEVTKTATIVLVDRAYHVLLTKVIDIEKKIIELEHSRSADNQDFDDYLFSKDIDFYKSLLASLKDE